MRLNESNRSAFIRAVLADVPNVDYSEQIAKVAREDLYKQYPLLIQEIIKNPELNQYLEQKSITVTRAPGYVQIYVYCSMASTAERMITPAARIVIDGLHTKMVEQAKVVKDLNEKLKATVKSVNTTEQLIKLMPEFEKYVPKEDVKPSNLPAVSNLVGDLLRAGWPKDKPPVKSIKGKK